MCIGGLKKVLLLILIVNQFETLVYCFEIGAKVNL